MKSNPKNFFFFANFLIQSLFFSVVVTCFAVPNAGVKQENELVEQEFQKSKIELLPLNPDQIKQYIKKMFETEESIRDYPIPKIVSKTVRISLIPGSLTPEVNIVAGYVTPLAFYDVTGAPWPVTSKIIGNESFFIVNRPEVSPGNLLTISPKTKYAATNLIVTLEGHDLPVNIQLGTVNPQDEDKVTDGLIALQIDQRGPQAAAPIVGDIVQSSITDEMLSFIDNITPDGASILNISPKVPSMSAWYYKGMMYVRTQNALRWPSWDQIAHTAGGEFAVYRLPIESSVMISIDGRTETINLEESE